MKQMYRYIILAAIGSFLFACQQETEWAERTEKGKIEIRFSTAVNALLTKADPDPDNEIVEGQKVGIYVIEKIKNTTDTIIAGNAQYKSEAGGTLISVIDTVYHFPEINDVYVYAYHPYAATSNGNFQVKKDQSNKILNNDEDYYNSDLLYAARDSFSRFNNPIQLKFKHMLSKITYEVKDNSGTPLTSSSEVKITDIRLDASFNAVTGVLDSLQTNQVDTVTMNKNFKAAIIPPQSILVGKNFLEITVTKSNGGKMVYVYNTENEPTPIKFEPGKEYNFKITVDDDTFKIKYDISNWEWQPTENGSAGPV